MALIGAAFGLGFTFGPLIGYAALAFAKSEAEIGASPWPGYAAAALSFAAFLLALALLPEEDRRRFDDVTLLLPPAQQSRFAELDSASRAETARLFFTGKDPLFLTDVNERSDFRWENWLRG